MKRLYIVLASLSGVLCAGASASATLILHYNFDQTDSTAHWTDPTQSSPALVPDASGNGLNGLFRDGNAHADANKFVATGGPLGGAWDFDGTDIVEFAYGGLPASAQDSLTGNSARAVSVWLNPDTFGDRRFFGYAGTGTAGEFLGLTVEQDATGAYVGFRRGGGFEIYRPTQSTNPFDVEELVHVAFVVPDGATLTGDALVYVNGMLATRSSNNGSNPTLNTSSLPAGSGTMAANDYIGVGRKGDAAGAGGGTTPGFDGLIADFQLYDSALSADEVDYLFDNPGAVIPEPAGWVLTICALVFSLRTLRSKCLCRFCDPL